ncbi:MAG: dioxygenase [Actinomycetota bacterium]
MESPTRMPAAFIGHGNPMNTLEDNRFTAAWRALGRSLPRPRAILCVSAHWYINGTAVTAMGQPRVIHDFYGFPLALFEFDYPAPGAPEVASEVADIPVLQLSIHAGQDADYHLDLGARLAPLRDRGVLIVGSGNVVHNLRRIAWRSDQGFDWGERFDAAVKRCMVSDPGALPGLEAHPDYALSVPTPEHYLPLLYLAGLCQEAKQPAAAFVEGCTLGSLSMTSYVLGLPVIDREREGQTGAAPMPDPHQVPPEDTNI